MIFHTIGAPQMREDHYGDCRQIYARAEGMNAMIVGQRVVNDADADGTPAEVHYTFDDRIATAIYSDTAGFARVCTDLGETRDVYVPAYEVVPLKFCKLWPNSSNDSLGTGANNESVYALYPPSAPVADDDTASHVIATQFETQSQTELDANSEVTLSWSTSNLVQREIQVDIQREEAGEWRNWRSVTDSDGTLVNANPVWFSQTSGDITFPSGTFTAGRMYRTRVRARDSHQHATDWTGYVEKTFAAEVEEEAFVSIRHVGFCGYWGGDIVYSTNQSYINYNYVFELTYTGTSIQEQNELILLSQSTTNPDEFHTMTHGLKAIDSYGMASIGSTGDLSGSSLSHNIQISPVELNATTGNSRPIGEWDGMMFRSGHPWVYNSDDTFNVYFGLSPLHFPPNELSSLISIEGIEVYSTLASISDRIIPYWYMESPADEDAAVSNTLHFDMPRNSRSIHIYAKGVDSNNDVDFTLVSGGAVHSSLRFAITWNDGAGTSVGWGTGEQTTNALSVDGDERSISFPANELQPANSSYEYWFKCYDSSGTLLGTSPKLTINT